MSKKKFRKSVESIRYQVIRHYQKIADEEQKESPDENLINCPSGEAEGRGQEAGGKILVKNKAFLPRPIGFRVPHQIFDLVVFD